MDTTTCPQCQRELKPYQSKDGVLKFRRHKNGNGEWCPQEIAEQPKPLVEVLAPEPEPEVEAPSEGVREPERMPESEPDPIVDCPQCETRLASTVAGIKVCWVCGFRSDSGKDELDAILDKEWPA